MNSKSEYNRSLLPSIRLNDKKSPWELSELNDAEVKEGMKALRMKEKELKVNLNLTNEDELELVTIEEELEDKISDTMDDENLGRDDENTKNVGVYTEPSFIRLNLLETIR